VYYRTKAAYVFWMLRDLAGDAALSAALRAYNPAADVSLGYGKDTGPSAFEKLLKGAGNVQAGNVQTGNDQVENAQAGPSRDLSWFFADWVNADKGLPDLTIASVFPTPEETGNWLVTVNIVNNGYASAEVPVTVRSNANTITQRVLVPARAKAAPRLLILGKPTEVQVNDGVVPETQATVHITRLDQPTPDQPRPDQPAGSSSSQPALPQP
jgi:hypothetical protein